MRLHRGNQHASFCEQASGLFERGGDAETEPRDQRHPAGPERTRQQYRHTREAGQQSVVGGIRRRVHPQRRTPHGDEERRGDQRDATVRHPVAEIRHERRQCSLDSQQPQPNGEQIVTSQPEQPAVQIEQGRAIDVSDVAVEQSTGDRHASSGR